MGSWRETGLLGLWRREGRPTVKKALRRVRPCSSWGLVLKGKGQRHVGGRSLSEGDSCWPGVWALEEPFHVSRLLGLLLGSMYLTHTSTGEEGASLYKTAL